MRMDDSVVRSRKLAPHESGVLTGFTRQEAGWDWMDFSVRRLLKGENLDLRTHAEEMALVILGGECVMDWGQGGQRAGERKSVFEGLPFTLYLPAAHTVAITAATDCEIAECRVPSNAQMEPRLILPGDVVSSLRGGENSSRQVVDVIGSDFPADKLIIFEVYTPGGNWSSYPPHKHDVDNLPEEADFDEIYYYRMRDPQGYALQNLYNHATQRDDVIKVHDGDAVLVRDGFHPVVAGPGYDTYYLNFLAGTSRTLAVKEDSSHAWLRSTWKQPDARLPMVGG
jgi:5-deoxy-glucuronate isomerase